MLQIVFGLTLAWLPVGGWATARLRNLILPVVTLALPQIAVIARMTRGRDDRDPAVEPYPHPALARPADCASSCAMRCAARPCRSCPISGPAAAALLTGSVVVETIFGLPGIGRYFVEGRSTATTRSSWARSWSSRSSCSLFNLVVDILYALIDPRVRYDEVPWLRRRRPADS